MKIYHKFLLYQNKLLKPYVRILLGLIEALTYLASLSLIVGVVYEHGFPLSIDEVANLQTLYKTVWIIFLIDVTLHISLEYRGEIIDLGADLGIIKKSGSWYSYNDTKLGQGRDAAKQCIMDNPELAEELEGLIFEELKKK